MKKAMKGMIIFFSVVLVVILGFMAYVLIRGGEGVSFFSSGEDGFSIGTTLVGTEKIDSSGISAIDITVSSADIKFKTADGNEIIIEEYAGGQAKKVQTISAVKSDSNFKVTMDTQRVNNWVMFGSNYRYLEVYLPADYSKTMRIRTTSGDIYADNELKAAEFTVGTSSGYLYLADVSADSISIQTSSGDVNADIFSGPAKIQCSSGYVRIKENIGDTSVSTNSGDVTLSSMKGNLDVQTSSGYVKAENIVGKARVKTSSGDVTLDFQELTGDLDIETTSGYVRCNIPEDTGFEFSASTNSGDIDTYFDDFLGYDKKGKKAGGTIGSSSDREVRIQTSSGDIRLNNK